MKKISIIILFLFSVLSVYAQDILGGEVRVIRLQPMFHYDLEVHTYINDSSATPQPNIPVYHGISYTNFLLIVDSLYENNIRHRRFTLPNYVMTFSGEGFWIEDTLNAIDYENVEDSVGSFVARISTHFIQTGAAHLNASSTPTCTNYRGVFQDSAGVLLYNLQCSDINDDILQFHLIDSMYGETYAPVPQGMTIDDNGIIRWHNPPNHDKNYLIFVELIERRGSISGGNSQMNKFYVLNPSKREIYTSSQQIKQEEDFTLFPNPTTSTITIATPNFKNKTLTLYSMLGEALEMHRLTSPQHELDLSRYAAGMYIVQLSDGRQVWSRKVVKW